MKIREADAFDERYARFDASAAEETIHELELQFQNGEIDRYTYFEKKRSLVRLFLKATTAPKRRPRGGGLDA